MVAGNLNTNIPILIKRRYLSLHSLPLLQLLTRHTYKLVFVLELLTHFYSEKVESRRDKSGLSRVGDKNRDVLAGEKESYSAVQSSRQHVGKTVVLRGERSKSTSFAVVSEPKSVHVLSHLFKYWGLQF